VYGNIYDLSLDKAKGAVVEVNTTPSQHLIAAEGKYAFEIPRGTYKITASLRERGERVALENRTITVLEDGNYVLDFILFPMLEEEEDPEIDVGEVVGREGGRGAWIGLIVLVTLAGGGALLYHKRKKRPLPSHSIKEENSPSSDHDDDEDLKKVLAIIKEQGGRTTQKDIRKGMPLSEAKISLLIAELEHKGRVEKIKKGRGNIVVLKK
jgi:uncharacterized membrane protein